MLYYIGQDYNILSRLKRENRSCELTCLQVQVRSDIQNSPGWRPLASEELSPICPNIHDTFFMNSYYDKQRDGEAPEETDYKLWRVIERDIYFSGPMAQEMSGIVRLTVELIEK